MKNGKNRKAGLTALKKKLKKIKGKPRQVSSGYALGLFLATTPFIGLKIFIALIVSSVFGWSKVSAAIGVYHVNSLTAPLFYSFSFLIGKAALGVEVDFSFPDHLSFKSIFETFIGNSDVFLSLLTGGLILGIPIAWIAYRFSYRIVANASGV